MSTIAGREIDLDADLAAAPNEFWYTRCPVPTVFEIALESGALGRELERRGKQWRQLAESTNPAVHQSHFTHRQANSFRHGGNVPAIWARSRGADTRVIGISEPDVSCSIYVLDDSDIETVADLAGRKILVPKRSEVAIDFWAASTLKIFDSALRGVGLGFGDVELVEVIGETHRIFDSETATEEGRQRWALRDRNSFTRAALGPLIRGDVDAVTTQGVRGEQVASLAGARRIYEQIAETDPALRANNGNPDVLTVSAGLLEEEPETVGAVVAVLLRAAAWGRQHRAETLRLFGQRLQVSELELALAYRDIPTTLDLALPDRGVRGLQAQHDFLLEHSFIETPFDVDEWIDPRPLEYARKYIGAGDDAAQ